jgi:hypothetical protein
MITLQVMKIYASYMETNLQQNYMSWIITGLWCRCTSVKYTLLRRFTEHNGTIWFIHHFKKMFRLRVVYAHMRGNLDYKIQYRPSTYAISNAVSKRTSRSLSYAFFTLVNRVIGHLVTKKDLIVQGIHYIHATQRHTGPSLWDTLPHRRDHIDTWNTQGPRPSTWNTLPHRQKLMRKRLKPLKRN